MSGCRNGVLSCFERVLLLRLGVANSLSLYLFTLSRLCSDLMLLTRRKPPAGAASSELLI